MVFLLGFLVTPFWPDGGGVLGAIDFVNIS